MRSPLVLITIVLVQVARLSAFIFPCTGCVPFDPNAAPPPVSQHNNDVIAHDVNVAVYRQLSYDSPHNDRALKLIRLNSIRTLSMNSIGDIDEFSERCREGPFSSDEAHEIIEEFHAQHAIALAIATVMELQELGPEDSLADLRSRYAQFAMRIHMAIARSLELLPDPIIYEPRSGLIAFAIAWSLITITLGAMLVLRVFSLRRRDSERFGEGVRRVRHACDQATIRVLNAAALPKDRLSLKASSRGSSARRQLHESRKRARKERPQLPSVWSNLPNTLGPVSTQHYFIGQPILP